MDPMGHWDYPRIDMFFFIFLHFKMTQRKRGCLYDSPCFLCVNDKNYSNSPVNLVWIERNCCYVWVLMVVVAWCKNGAETIYSHKVHGWVSLSEVHLVHLRHISKDPGRSPKVKSIAMPYSQTSFGILVGPGTGATYEWKRGSGL